MSFHYQNNPMICLTPFCRVGCDIGLICERFNEIYQVEAWRPQIITLLHNFFFSVCHAPFFFQLTQYSKEVLVAAQVFLTHKKIPHYSLYKAKTTINEEENHKFYEPETSRK